MQALDFIATARDLASSSRGRPRQTNLRRAISTTCYALFHCLAACCADMPVGGEGANRSKPAWRQAYRALQHRQARNRCRHGNIRGFPNEVQDLANVFADMQTKRHGADYDPDAAFSQARCRAGHQRGGGHDSALPACAREGPARLCGLPAVRHQRLIRRAGTPLTPACAAAGRPRGSRPGATRSSRAFRTLGRRLSTAA